MQSDLEEGEIPEFEVEPFGFDKREMLLRSRVIHSGHGRNNKELNRYGSPPSEGEYISEEEILVKRKRMSRKDLYKKNSGPMHPTYGSVEDIMTKIGESLGRHSNYYYKGKRPKEPRYVITINDSRDMNSMLREASPFLKRLNRYNYRRPAETSSESVNNIREKCGKMKCKKLLEARRSGKECPRKRKREHGKINEDGTAKCKRLRFFEEKEKKIRKHNKKQRKHGLRMRLFKEIPVLEEQKLEENNVKVLPNSEDSNCLHDDPKDSLSHTIEKSNLVDSLATVTLDDESGIQNCTPNFEQSNNGEDDDDDTELIKLRLLALTSNKKKSQSFSDNCLDNVKDLKKHIEENGSDDLKSYLVDDEKTKENSSPRNDDSVTERRIDNEIDRYELFLRAEALKTALLRKHQRILIKRKNFGAVSRNRKAVGSEDSNESKTVKRDELDFDILSDEELVEKNQDSNFGAQTQVTENNGKLERRDEDENKLNPENNKEELVKTDVYHGDGLPSENLVVADNVDQCEKSSVPVESCTPESDKASKDMGIDLKNTPMGPQLGKKKVKRTKMRQIKKSVNASEADVKENNTGCEKKGDCQDTKSSYSIDLGGKNEEKFFLFDTRTSSNPEINASNNNFNGQLSLDAKQNHKSVVNQKAIPLNNEESAAKIPETERIIVHLGSDSSDDESVPDCQSHIKSDAVENEESKEVNPLPSVDSQNSLEEFERSVELLLIGARRKIERRKELLSGIQSTPEAVYSHLAPSQRLEYIRLKQKIAEREKLRKVEKDKVNNSSAQKGNKSKVNSIEDKNISPINSQKSIGQRPTFGLNARQYNNALVFENQLKVKGIRNSPNKNFALSTPNYGLFGNRTARVNQFSNIKKPLPEPNSQRGTAITIKKDFADLNSRNTIKTGPSEIVIERKKMLNQNRLHLERLKILWKNIKIEKMIEARYEKEIKKLKMQQNLFELKVNQQRSKIKKLADESQQIYEAFQKNNRRVAVISKKKKIVAPKTENEEKKIKYSDKIGADEQEREKATANKENGKDITEKDERKATADKEYGKDTVEKDKQNGKGTAEEEKKSAEDIAEKEKENVEDTEEKDSVEDTAEKEKESENVEKDVVRDTVENEVRLIAMDTEIGVNEKIQWEDVEMNTEEKVDKGTKYDAEEEFTVTDKSILLMEYNSPLQILTARSESLNYPRIDPNVIMCQYDLFGKCNDEECPYQHWRT